MSALTGQPLRVVGARLESSTRSPSAANGSTLRPLTTDELAALVNGCELGLPGDRQLHRRVTAGKHIFLSHFSAKHNYVNSLGLACQATSLPSKSPHALDISKLGEKNIVYKGVTLWYVITQFLEVM